MVFLEPDIGLDGVNSENNRTRILVRWTVLLVLCFF